MKSDRLYLVVLADDTPEIRAAVRFAALRAKAMEGQVALFYATDNPEFQHFGAISELMEAEARTEGEHRLQRVAADVYALCGMYPVLYLRQGPTQDELLALLDDEALHINVVVLAASTSADGPGSLVSAMGGKLAARINVPVVIVPGELTDEQIDFTIS